MLIVLVALLALNVAVALLHLRVSQRVCAEAMATVVPVADEMGDVLAAMDKAAVTAVTAAERVETLLHHLDTKVTLIATTSLGIASHAESVADDLRQSHERADQTAAIPGVSPGEAADAASQSPDPETTNARP